MLKSSDELFNLFTSKEKDWENNEKTILDFCLFVGENYLGQTIPEIVNLTNAIIKKVIEHYNQIKTLKKTKNTNSTNLENEMAWFETYSKLFMATDTAVGMAFAPLEIKEYKDNTIASVVELAVILASD